MAKYMLLGGFDKNWRLPAETDLVEVRHNLDYAFDNRYTAKVEVELGDDPRQPATVAVNPRAVGWWAIVEIADETKPPGSRWPPPAESRWGPR